MAVDLAKYTKLKQAVDAARREADRAAGALEQTTQQIKTEFKVGSLEAAEKLAAKLEKEAAEAEAEFADALADFEKLWKEKL